MPAVPRSHIAVVNSINGMPPVPGNTATAQENASAGWTAPEAAQDEQTYANQRSDLIAHERQRRFDAVKRARRSNQEREADDYIRTLRAQEIKDVYDAPGKVSVAKGSTWSRAKSRGVEHGALYGLIKRMPKGAILHCHLDATVDAIWLIRQTYAEDDLYLRAEQPLSSHASLYTTSIVFRQLPPTVGTPADGGFDRAAQGHEDIYDEASYKPNTWVRLSKARYTFPYINIYEQPQDGYESALKNFTEPLPESSPKANAFDACLFSLMTFTPVPSSLRAPIVTSKEAWAFFATTFGIIEGLQTHKIRLAYYIRSLRIAAADNVCYVEARVNFFDEFFTGPDAQASLSHAGMVALFEQALAIVQAELPVDAQPFDAKIIYSTLKFIDGQRLQWYIDDAIALKQQFPNRIVGFDIVGHEDHGVTLQTYVPQLLGMQRRLRELNVDLPFCFHAGETLGDGDAIDDNLYDAILLGTKRIGHGFSLARHPTLVDLVRQHGICIESCPISSQVLCYADTLAVHPVLTMLAYGLPVALSNDDPCQFLNLGLSPDFYSVLVASDHIDLTSLGVLARNSLEHSLIPDPQQKADMLTAWDRKWTAFVQGVCEQVQND